MTEAVETQVEEDVGISPRSFQGCILAGKPALLMYDSVKDETLTVDCNHELYPQAMAALSVIEMAFAPILQANPQKKTILHVEKPKLITGIRH